MPQGNDRRTIEPAALLLDGNGVIEDCTPTAASLFGYSRAQLAARAVATLVPGLAEFRLLVHGEPNPRLLLLCHLGTPFEAHRCDSTRFRCKLSLSFVGPDRSRRLRLTVVPLQPT